MVGFKGPCPVKYVKRVLSSTFSTSTGCVCTTEKQRDYVNNRGNNNPLSLDNSDI